MIPQETLRPIVIGESWSHEFQIGSNDQPILGSTNASPIVVSVNQASYFFSNGNSVLVAGHDNDAANGVWTVAGVTQTTLQLTGSTGSGIGNQFGSIADVIDATTGNAYLFILSSFSSNVPIFIFTNNNSFTSPILSRFTFIGSAPTGTFAWNNQSQCDFTCSLSIAQVYTLNQYAGTNLYGLLYYVDSSNTSTAEERIVIPIQQ